MAMRVCGVLTLTGAIMRLSAAALGAPAHQWEGYLWPAIAITWVWWAVAARASRGGPALGVRMRVQSRAGTLIEADSDHLHLVAKYGSGGPPGDWYQIFPG